MTVHDAEPRRESEHSGYGELVRHNANFRRLWLGNVISLLGDWFNTIALYSLVSRITGSPLALGAVFIFKMLPWALASPVAGVIVDRLNRRRVMIASDLLRAVVVLGFLLVDQPSEVYLLFGLATLQVVIGAVFEPARSASLPQITTPRQLLTANALMSATWSIMLAAGAASGGLATQWLGVRAVFLIDSLTYLVSAFFIFRTTIPQETDPPEKGPIVRTAVRGILDGWQHLRKHPRIARIASAKANWALSGGALVYMLALLGEEIAPGAQAAGMGVLFAARGLGTGIGPILARVLFKSEARWPAVLGSCVVFSGICYAAVGSVPWTWGVTVLILIAHMASGAQWVLSAVMLQKRTEDRYRGRVFATEWLLVMLTNSLSILVASSLLEASVFDLRDAVRTFAVLQVASGVVWGLLVVPGERQARAVRSGG